MILTDGKTTLYVEKTGQNDSRGAESFVCRQISLSPAISAQIPQCREDRHLWCSFLLYLTPNCREEIQKILPPKRMRLDGFPPRHRKNLYFRTTPGRGESPSAPGLSARGTLRDLFSNTMLLLFCLCCLHGVQKSYFVTQSQIKKCSPEQVNRF